MDRRRIGEKIAELRKSQGLTQVQLAEKSGLGIASIVRYEKGATFPRGDNLQRLAAGLNVDSKIFFEKETQPDTQQLKSRIFDSSIPFSNTHFEALSNEGKEKVRQYISDLYFAEQFVRGNEACADATPENDQHDRLAATADLIHKAEESAESQNEKKA